MGWVKLVGIEWVLSPEISRFLSELENGKPTLEIDKVLNVARLFGIDIEANNR